MILARGMNGVETCPWFGSRQHCQKEKDPILSLLWEKPELPLLFLCVWGTIQLPISPKPTFHPPVTSGGRSFYLGGKKYRKKKNIFKRTKLKWLFWKVSNKKKCRSKPARAFKFKIHAASTCPQNCKKCLRKKKTKILSQILKPRVTWYSSYAVLHVQGSSIVRQKFTNLG